MIFCYVLLCFSLIPSLYSSLKSEGHSFVSDEVVSFLMNIIYSSLLVFTKMCEADDVSGETELEVTAKSIAK